jgi:hypothetical protein
MISAGNGRRGRPAQALSRACTASRWYPSTWFNNGTALRWRCSHRLFPGPCGRVAQSHQFRARRLRFDLNPEPDYCYHCEGWHSFQRHRVSLQALVPLDTRQHTAILAHQVRASSARAAAVSAAPSEYRHTCYSHRSNFRCQTVSRPTTSDEPRIESRFSHEAREFAQFRRFQKP